MEAATRPPYFEMEKEGEERGSASWTDVSGKTGGGQTVYFKRSEEGNIQNKLLQGHAAIGCFSDVLFIFNLLPKTMKLFLFLFPVYFFS